MLVYVSSLSLFADETVHIMQKGETLYSIAQRYSVKTDDILSLNGITDARKVQAGQRIRIPDTQSDAVNTLSAVTGAYIEYQVARGETFFGIARQYDLSVDTLRNTNGLSSDYVLKAGDRLRIPQAGASAVVAAVSTSSLTELPTPAPQLAPYNTTSGPVTAEPLADTAVRWPVAAKAVSYLTGKLQGVAITGEKDESITNLTEGTVVSAGPYRGFGRVVIVQGTGGYLYVYGGAESLSVKEGDRVAPGTELGKLGIDTVSEKPQLFFLVYRNNSPVDPAKAPRA